VPPDRFARRHLLKTSLAAGALAATAPWLARSPRPSPAATAALAITPAAGGPGALFAELEDFVARRMAELKVPGVALGVTANGEEYSAGFGVTNLDHPLPVDADTLFQIGSIGKTYTGTAVMRLVEQGTLDLEAPVRRYLPEFRVADEQVSAEVRLRHLVTHTAGWFGDDFTETGDGDDALARYVAAMADLPQLAPLGKYFGYNNAAVALAGRVVEVATGLPFEAAVGELVLAPLGLERTFFGAEEIMTEAFAVGHAPPPDDPAGAPAVARPWAFPRAVNPTGGVVSSVRDMLRYARFHLGDGTAGGERVVSPAGLRRMRTPLGPGGAHGPYLLDGVGVSWLLATIGGEPIAMHGGSSNGQQSSFLLVPERGFAVTALTNAEAGAALAEEVSRWALERFLGLTEPAPTPVATPPARLGEYVGDYDVRPGVRISVGEEGGGLTFAYTEGGRPLPGLSGPLPLVGADRATFALEGFQLLTDFVRDDAGEVAWIRFSSRLAPRSR